MYAIVWKETRHVGIFAARREGKLLAMTVLTFLPSFCAHYGRQLSLLRQNLARKFKLHLQNIWLPLQSCQRDNTPLKHCAHSLQGLSDNMDSCFYSQSRSVYAGQKFTKHHGTESPLGQLGQS